MTRVQKNRAHLVTSFVFVLIGPVAIALLYILGYSLVVLLGISIAYVFMALVRTINIEKEITRPTSSFEKKMDLKWVQLLEKYFGIRILQAIRIQENR